MNHEYNVTGSWQGGRAGLGEVRTEHVSTLISLGKEIGGSARGTNPEEMLVATAASCFLITLSIMLEKRAIPFSALSVNSTGTLDLELLKITKIVHQPKVTLTSAATAEQSASLPALMHQAEKFCLISNAIRGNVEVTLQLP